MFIRIDWMADLDQMVLYLFQLLVNNYRQSSELKTGTHNFDILTFSPLCFLSNIHAIHFPLEDMIV